MKCLFLPLIFLPFLASAEAQTAKPLPTAVTPDRAQPVKSSFVAGPLTVDVVDYSPLFLAWHKAAQSAPDADARFALWKSMYGMAAVPPTPQGQQMARSLVDAAWPRYDGYLPFIRAGAAGMAVDKEKVLTKVAYVLGLTEPAHIRLVTIVSGFELNAYSYRADLPTVVVTLEAPPAYTEVVLAHESAHAMHMELGKLSGQWERSIAATLMQEGLAMHVAQAVFPGRPVETYVGDAGWWNAVQPQRSAILKGIRQELLASDSDTVTKYTMGKGNVGLNREAYAAGWWVIEQMQADGMTLAQIARIPEADLPARAEAAIDRLLKS